VYAHPLVAAVDERIERAIHAPHADNDYFQGWPPGPPLRAIVHDLSAEPGKPGRRLRSELHTRHEPMTSSARYYGAPHRGQIDAILGTRNRPNSVPQPAVLRPVNPVSPVVVVAGEAGLLEPQGPSREMILREKKRALVEQMRERRKKSGRAGLE